MSVSREVIFRVTVRIFGVQYSGAEPWLCHTAAHTGFLAVQTIRERQPARLKITQAEINGNMLGDSSLQLFFQWVTDEA